MGDGRQDQKATPMKAGTDPGSGKPQPPGKAPPLPARASNGGVQSPRSVPVAAQDATSGISPVAPTAAPRAGSSDDLVSIPIDTEPPVAVVQSGDTAPPPPELAVAQISVPAPA